MDAHEFYRLLFAPLAKAYGPPDADTIVALIGFDAGGPLNFCTCNASHGDVPTTYVSCELARHCPIAQAVNDALRQQLEARKKAGGV